MINLALEQYTLELKRRKLLPKKLEFAQFHDWHLVSAYSLEDNLSISEQVTMGIDLNYEVAYAKALTEYQERNLLNGVHHVSFDLHEKSDGVAAFPAHFLDAKKRVRQNAYNEAVERFLWATWWDNPTVRYELMDASHLPYAKELIAKFHLENISSIYLKHRPSTSISSPIDLHILLAKTKEGGFITGGAAGGGQESLEIFNRAFGELLRHLVVFEAFKNGKSPTSFYEKRLWGFASGAWSELVEERLSYKGALTIELPALIVDEGISHPHDDLVLIYRTLFKDQPLFVGGALERLCL